MKGYCSYSQKPFQPDNLLFLHFKFIQNPLKKVKEKNSKSFQNILEMSRKT